jgi:hypothetical protein
MIAARCYRTLDRPITVFGLEIEDLVLVIVAGGALLFAAGPFLGIGAALALFAAMHRLKAGRPPAYVYERLYRFGIVERCPFLAVPHLVPLRRRYSPVTSDDEEEHPIENSYWRVR